MKTTFKSGASMSVSMNILKAGILTVAAFSLTGCFGQVRDLDQRVTALESRSVAFNFLEPEEKTANKFYSDSPAGLVVATINVPGKHPSRGGVSGIAGIGEAPTTVRAVAHVQYAGQSTDVDAYIPTATITMPIRKGETWKVVSNPGFAVSVHFLPVAASYLDAK